MVRPLLIPLFLLSAACSAGFDEAKPLGVDANTGEDMNDDGLVRLEIDPPPPLWEYYSIPITGRGPSGGTLLFGTPAGQQQATLADDGSFCVDVPLTPDSVTSVTFEAVSAQGEYTAPVTVQVQQTGEPPDTEDPPETGGTSISNTAYGASNIYLHGSVESGSLQALVDGDTSAAVSIRNDSSGSFPEDFFNFSLREPGDVKQIVVYSDNSCVLKSYDIFLNQKADAGPLFVAGGTLGAGWVRVAVINNGTSKSEISISGAPNVRQFGLHFRSDDCGPTIGAGRHKVAEVQVYAEVEDVGTDIGGDGSPSCVSGGSGF